MEKTFNLTKKFYINIDKIRNRNVLVHVLNALEDLGFKIYKNSKNNILTDEYSFIVYNTDCDHDVHLASKNEQWEKI